MLQNYGTNQLRRLHKGLVLVLVLGLINSNVFGQKQETGSTNVILLNEKYKKSLKQIESTFELEKDSLITVIDLTVSYIGGLSVNRYVENDFTFTSYENGSTTKRYSDLAYKKYFSLLNEKSNNNYFAIGIEDNLYYGIQELHRLMKPYSEIYSDQTIFRENLSDFIFYNKFYQVDSKIYEANFVIQQSLTVDSLINDLYTDSTQVRSLLENLELAFKRELKKRDVELERSYYMNIINNLILESRGKKVYIIMDDKTFDIVGDMFPQPKNK